MKDKLESLPLVEIGHSPLLQIPPFTGILSRDEMRQKKGEKLANINHFRLP